MADLPSRERAIPQRGPSSLFSTSEWLRSSPHLVKLEQGRWRGDAVRVEVEAPAVVGPSPPNAWDG